MHRNGTSLVTRGLRSLGVYLGEDFLDTRPDNPTGYWENKEIVAIQDRLLGVYGLKWESVALITEKQWQAPEVEMLRAEAGSYLKRYFTHRPLWGFKDPRTIRLLPFWLPIFPAQEVDEQYVIVIRNPVSVAASLLQRQGMDALTSHQLWLLHMAQYVSRIAHRPFVVVDYDLLMADPRGQLERIAACLKIPLDETNRSEVEDFCRHFLDPGLRHNVAGQNDFDSTTPHVGRLTREAYLWLRQLATDRMEARSARFWSAFEEIRRSTELTIPSVPLDAN